MLNYIGAMGWLEIEVGVIEHDMTRSRAKYFALDTMNKAIKVTKRFQRNNQLQPFVT